MSNMITVTGYINPDIDCVACSIGYAEFLRKSLKEARAVYSGDIGKESEFVKKYLGFFSIMHVSGGLEGDQIVLVDTSDVKAIDLSIKKENIIEVIDHRKLSYIHDFPKAKMQIDLVGSCATLITERFHDKGIIPSKESAVLLFSAIVSNTVNFMSNVTTQRDKDMANWLKEYASIPQNYISDMFEYKSEINRENIEEVLTEEFKQYTISGKKIGMVQLEITEAIRRVSELGDDIKAKLCKIKSENQLDYLLLSCVDIKEGFNYFLTIDSESSDFFEKALGITAVYDGVKSEGIYMRKEIYPKLVKYLEDRKY